MTAWVVLFFVSLTAVSIIWALFFVHDSGSRARAVKYRDQYVRMIQELDLTVLKANQLYPNANKAKDVVLLDHYHSAIKMIESLLLAVRKLAPYGEDAEVLHAPLFLAKDIAERLCKIEHAMLKGQKGKPHEFMKSAPVLANTAIGCHFCSRPFDAQLFGKVRVKIDGKSEEVAACHYCREKLLTTRKARVLFFSEDGHQVHWSKAKSWTPSPEYWNINREDEVRNHKAPHLELIYSNVSRINHSGQKSE